jgi:electron transfer flavoprotein beta subunit
MGGHLVDRVIRIDGEPPDAWSAARLLAAMIATQGFDLVLCGRRAIDTHGGQLGSFIGELLDAPQVSGIVKLTLLKDGRKALVGRNLGRGDREEVECRLPALFTVDPGLNEPRYPTCPDRMLAEQTRIDVVDATSLPVDEAQATLTQFRKFSPPRPKTRKVFTIDSGLSVADRMSQMMSGGAGAAKKEGGELVEGTPEEAARHIVDFLVQNGLVQNGLAQNVLVQNGIVPGPGPS